MKSGKNPVLTRHVMRAGRYRTQRRTPQNEIERRVTQQVGEIGVATRELLDDGRTFSASHFAFEISSQGLYRKTFLGADRDDI